MHINLFKGKEAKKCYFAFFKLFRCSYFQLYVILETKHYSKVFQTGVYHRSRNRFMKIDVLPKT